MRSPSLQWLLISIFSCAVLLSAAQTVNACSCGPQPTVLESFDESDEVVIGATLSKTLTFPFPRWEKAKE